MTTEIQLSPEVEARINAAVSARFAELIEAQMKAQAEAKAAPRPEKRRRRLAIVASKGTLDMAYPPLILASAGAALGWEVAIFFTFYGLDVINAKRNKHLQVAPLGNPAMPVPVPNLVGAIPGMTAMATWMMRRMMKKQNMPPIPEMLDLCRQLGVRLIACSTTIGIMSVKDEDLIEGTECAGAAAFLEFASGADVTLFI